MGAPERMTLDDVLSDVTHLGIDTAPIIYFVEANPRYDALVTAIFQRIASGTLTGSISVLTLTEVLVQPIRLGAVILQRQYRDLLTSSEYFVLYAVDIAIADQAASLRANYNLRTPDALQISTALAGGCQAFLTNDIGLKRVTELKVILLDELLVR
jgi:predicted nucleic acid-binding protein